MKSFKQKIEERKARLIAERLLQEERDRQILKQQESDRIERQRIAKEQEAEQWAKEQELYEAQLWDRQERRRLKELRLERIEEEKRLKESQVNEIDWKDIVEFRSKQKDAIYEILNNEQKERNHIISERDRIENDLAHERYLAEQERKHLELEEKERLQLEEMERIEAEHIAEQEKYALWERLEKEENDRKEQERLEEERQRLEDEELRKTSEMLERIEAERIEYEERQQRIAEHQKESRDEVNKILQEAQNILHSNQQSSFKNKLSGLHDYIYRLDVTESDPWTDRKQPMSILTWEDWKQVPGNRILIEEDFKRARLLFEQDNMRAKRYHDYIWHEMPARNLTIQRKQALDDDGKLVDQDRYQLLNTRRELVKSIGDIQVWLDAADQNSIHAIATSSCTTASINVSWVPATKLGFNDTITLPSELNDSASLVVSGVSALFDGNPDTYMSIKHTSGSSEGVYDYDWLDRNEVADTSLESGIVFVRIRPPAEHYDKIVERVDVHSTDRKFIPEYVTGYQLNKAGTQWQRQVNYDITSSFNSSYNNQLAAGSEDTGLGGKYGITPEGSASLDPLQLNDLYPREYVTTGQGQPTYDERNYQNDYLLRVCIAATGSELRFHGLNIWYQDVSSSIEHTQGVHQWITQPGPDINPSASVWKRTIQPYGMSSRLSPLGYPVWYSASDNQPAGINMPYIQFSSRSLSCLSCKYEYADYSKTGGFTQFFVGRDTSGTKNHNNLWFGDSGNSYKTATKVGITGYPKLLYATLTDWDGVDLATNKNTRHTVQVQLAVAHNDPTETDLYGKTHYAPTASSWPYVGEYHHGHGDESQIQLLSGLAQRETGIYTHQLHNPMIASESRYRMWWKGGTPFVDMDATAVTDYSMTASAFGEPQIGASRAMEWGDFRLHEFITFKRQLSTHEIDTVHDYLAHKWMLPVYSVKSDADNDYVYGLSHSISSLDTWKYDATDETSTDTIWSSSAWEIG